MSFSRLAVFCVGVLGLSGCALSFLIGLRLLRAIGKSGHLDQKD